ncbi:TNF receptor-associated factor 6 [Oopsacas minuta]|uniref:TNF receptor-associated factor 6 n=1 Tax=Oopsacas minuta TaxID=111878 RepID=A0AAV7K0H1_9METZ|nr:TNF receptor-associated factor 6 [Oopsacas minuta]
MKHKCPQTLLCNISQQELANKQNLGLLEESLLKHEEHSAELDEVKTKLEVANNMNSKLSAKLTVVSDKYDDLTRESTDQQEKNDAIQRNQSELIQTLQDRVKMLETQLSNTPSPYRFSPTSDLGDETETKSDLQVSNLENENVKLLEKIDQLQFENKQLRENKIDPETDEEIIEYSSDEEGPSVESIVLPKPIFSQSKQAQDAKLKLQAHIDKLAHIQSIADSIDKDKHDFITKIARIQSTAMRRKQETPRTPYVWLVDSVSKQIEKEGLVYCQPFISDNSGHKIGALLDFSMAKSSHQPSIGFYVTMLPGNNDKKLKWPFRADFRVILLNYNNNDKCLVEKFTDSGNIAFQMPLKGKNLNMFGLTKFITVATLTNPKENRLYVKKDRMELHIEVKLKN